MIQILGLTKIYTHGLRRKQTAALREFSLSVSEGGSVGVVGPNGSGKTTLIKLLVGLLRPTLGTIRVFGEDPHNERVRARIGYLPERFVVPRFFTALNVLETVGGLQGIPRDELTRRIDALLSVCELGDWARRETTRYSKGMLQKLGLAQALINAPDLLILDEPFEALDPKARSDFKSLIRDTLRDGRSLLMCSHVLADIEELCDSLILLDRGRLVSALPVSEAVSQAGFAVFLPAGHPALAGGTEIDGRAVVRDGAAARIEVPDSRALQSLLRALDRMDITVTSIGQSGRRLERYFLFTMNSHDAPHP